MSVSGGQKLPVKVVGGSTFGLYPKISLEKTINMYVSENYLVNYPGFKKVSEILKSGEGRGLFNSIRGNIMVAVINQNVYVLNNDLAFTKVGALTTFTGDVYIDENLSSQICIVDGRFAYILNYSNNIFTFTQQTLLFNMLPIFPSYVCYHNSFFLFGSSPASANSSFWYAFQYASPTTISLVTQLSLQTKPDSALVVERLPGRGNNVLVLGSSVGEVWTQVGSAENYRRVQSFNIDNGIVAASTLAASDDLICWLGQNENNAPSIMLTDGSNAIRISTDGIDNLLSTVQYPEESDAFFFRNEGHLFYQLTFSNDVDNFSLVYDFNTKMFFHVSNENLDYHPARQLVYFNGTTYFVSIDDGSLYEMDQELYTYDYNISETSVGNEIPRIRICDTIRKPDDSIFRVAEFNFTMEQGVNAYYAGNPVIPRVDMAFFKDGNQSFSNFVGKQLNPAGNYKNRMRWQQLGMTNDFTIQLRFYGLQRFVVGASTLEIF